MSSNTGKRVIKSTKRNKPVKLTKKRNSSSSSSSSAPTFRNIEEERQIIINCCNTAGECYRFLGVKPNSTLKEIEESFEQLEEEIRNEVLDAGDNFTADQEAELQYRFDCCVSAYTILSNSRLRKLYDEEFLQKMVEIENEENYYNEMNEQYKSVLVELLASPFDIIVKRLATSTNSSKSIIKSLYEQGGYKSFFRGFAFTSLYPIVHSFIDYSIEKVLDSKLLFASNNNSTSNNKLKSIIHLIAFNITKYPFVFISDCISFAPLSMPIFKVIKNVVQKGDSGKFEFKNLFYSMASSMFLYATSKFISSSIKSIGNILIEKQRKNPNSTILKYGKIIYCNPIIQGILTAILVSPIHVIRLQYPYQFIQSLLTSPSSSIPKPINPISMALQIYNQHGFKKFFNGCLTIIIPQYTLLSIASRIKPNDISIYSI